MAMAVPHSQRETGVRFGSFEFDRAAGRLRKGGIEVKIQELPLRLLASLLENPGELVGHERLRALLWGNVTVDFDDGLRTAVRKLRDALGDSATNPVFVATVPRRGYRFIAPVSPVNGAGASPGSSSFPRKRVALGIGAFLGLLAALCTLLWFRGAALRRSDNLLDRDSFQVVTLSAYPGIQRSPAFSPDGRQLAFAWNGPGRENLDIYIDRFDGGSPQRLTTDPAADDFPAWSPKSDRIAFIRRNAVYLAPVKGGQESRLAEASGSGLSWSPDGSLLAISEQNSQTQPGGIFVVSVVTGKRRRLTTAGPLACDEFPAFSPDGKNIAFVHNLTTVSDVFVVASTGGPTRQLTAIGEPIQGIAWTPDNNSVVLSEATGLFRVAANARAPQLPARIDISAVGDRQPAISSSGSNWQLVFVRLLVGSDVWGMPIGNPGSAPASPIRIAGGALSNEGPSISPDGKRIAFSSSRTGVCEIWASRIDGSNPVQLTFFARGLGAGSPSWSPDGKSIAFDATLQGNRDIYVVRADGGPVQRLTDQPSNEAQPSWSSDGRWIFFMSDRSGARQIWKMAADGGHPIQLTNGGGYQAFAAPDGKLVYYAKQRLGHGIWSVPVAGGVEQPVLEAAWPNAWTVARDGIYYLDFDKATPSTTPVKRFDFKTGKLAAVATIPMSVPPNLPAFSVRGDGLWAAWVSSRDRNSLLMLVRGFH